MGGRGSGRWRSGSGRRLCEDVPALSRTALSRAGLLRDEALGTGPHPLTWTDPRTGELVSTEGTTDTQCALSAPPQRQLVLDLTADAPGGAATVHIEILSEPLPWGGHRWWFLCPRCRRRKGKL